MTPAPVPFRPRGPYNQWAAWLDEFSLGTATSPSGLPPLDERLDPTTADLITELLVTAFRRRTDLWLDETLRDFEKAVSAGPDRLPAFLSHARIRLQWIRDTLHDCPGLPQSARDSLDEALTELAESTQQELDRWAARQSEPGRLRQLVRSNAIIFLRPERSAPATPSGAPPTGPPGPTGPTGPPGPPDQDVRASPVRRRPIIL